MSCGVGLMVFSKRFSPRARLVERRGHGSAAAAIRGSPVPATPMTGAMRRSEACSSTAQASRPSHHAVEDLAVTDQKTFHAFAHSGSASLAVIHATEHDLRFDRSAIGTQPLNSLGITVDQ